MDKELQNQILMTEALNQTIEQLENKYHLDGYWDHRHLCTFDMLDSEDCKEENCAEWRAKHPVRFPKNGISQLVQKIIATFVR